MEIRVLGSDFKLRGIIDGALELRYSEKFREAGEFFAKIPFTKENYALLKPPSRILVEELLYTVERVSCTEDEIKVSAEGIFSEFKNIYVTEALEIEDSPTAILSQLARELGIQGVGYEVYSSGLRDDRVVLAYGCCSDYYSIMSQLCQDYELGFRMLYNPLKNELGFYLMHVSDRASVYASGYTVISDERDSYTRIEAITDVSDYKNRIEFIYRLNLTGNLESVVYERSDIGEAQRGCVEHPRVLASTREELVKELNALAAKRFGELRKKRYFKVWLRDNINHSLGNLCAVEASRIGEYATALLTEREIEIKDTVRSEILLLEVQ